MKISAPKATAKKWWQETFSSRMARLAGGIVVGVWLMLGWAQNQMPDRLMLAETPAEAPIGTTTVGVLADMMEVQLDSFGGWLPNDLPLSPSYYTDNTANFQLGVLQVARHASRVLRDNLSRQRTSDTVDKAADQAYSLLANDPLKWMFPSAEGAFGGGVEQLRDFQNRLGDTAGFYPRSDNLVQLLESLASELGAVNDRLLQARKSDEVSWNLVDDQFYYSQGVAWAMLALVEAIAVDFERVLMDKNAMEITRMIVTSLEEAQFDPWIVTNGGKSGVLANHSSNLKAFLDDARQKINSLISILRQG